jgi:hypothetical protein
MGRLPAQPQGELRALAPEMGRLRHMLVPVPKHVDRQQLYFSDRQAIIIATWKTGATKFFPELRTGLPAIFIAGLAAPVRVYSMIRLTFRRIVIVTVLRASSCGTTGSSRLTGVASE